ncbi:ABC transporter permease [Paraflavisolibacter sp. H34]|uniref:ABC transporter permease n=1 Tax=Huijunlia imazamoxiresistens TaxID=3127457 RepID=UPI003018E59A
MQTLDVFSLAFRSVRSNRLRSGITVAIIAFGIMALVGIVTAIQAMNQKLTESFSTMGANGFSIRYKERSFRMGGNNSLSLKVARKSARKQKQSSLGRLVTKDEAREFVNRYRFPALAGISVMATKSAIVTAGGRKTNPNVFLFGGDEHYLALNGFEVERGRNFTRQEVLAGGSVCIVGPDVAKKLFPDRPERAVNSTLRINGRPYRVIGLLASRGATFGFSRDNLVLTSYNNVERNFVATASYVIGIQARNVNQVEEAMGEAEGLFRGIRGLQVTEESNFVLDRSNSVAEKAMNSLGFLTISATIIGLITVIGAAIGLMNIMLVSVTERTREVGLIKAIGGKSRVIRLQFLAEALIISVLGALSGILMGIGVGNIFSMVLNTGFVVPWRWILYGVAICSAVGFLAGLYPAVKAGKLSPITALRYE